VVFSDFKQIKDDSTEAIILFNRGSATIEGLRGTTIKYHIRYQILKKNALNSWGGSFKFKFPKNASLKPRGFTYNLDNGVILKSELYDGAVMKKKYNKYNDEISIAFPNVKEGSIVELEYILKNDDLYLPTWKFQYDIPVMESEYWIHAPTSDYLTHMRGQIKPTKHEQKYNGKYQYWLMRDIPAFKSENLIPDETVFISSIEFSTIAQSWGEIYALLKTSKRFWEGLKPNDIIRKKVSELVTGVQDSLLMISLISNYIKNEIQFTGIEDFLTDPVDEVFEKKQGTVADINLLLATMLKTAGFKVSLVLLSTRSHGFVLKDFISAHQFNYVICEVIVNKKELHIDATQTRLPYNC
jgi:hypothetical protein